MEEDDVAVGDELCQLRGRRSQRLLVELALAGAELAAVAGDAVEQVVGRFVSSKKGGSPVGSQPKRLSRAIRDVGEQRLRSSATPPPREVELTCQIERSREGASPSSMPRSTSPKRRRERRGPLRVHAPDVDLLQELHGGRLFAGR